MISLHHIRSKIYRYDYKSKADEVFNQYNRKVAEYEKKNKKYIHVNQEECTKIILSKLIENKLSIVTLVALPQVGKSGVMCCCAIVAASYGYDSDNFSNTTKPENIFAITGLSSIDFKTQLKNDFLDIFAQNVFHNNDLSKFQKRIKEISDDERILIMVDEAHIANKHGQRIDAVLKEILGITDEKINIKNYKNNIKFILISATPGNLLYDIGTLDNSFQSFTYLEPPLSYIGFKDFLEQKRMEHSTKITQGLLKRFEQVIKIRFIEPRYHILRIKNEKDANIVKQWCEKNNYEYLEHTQKNKILTDSLMSTKPYKHTVIRIIATFTAGQRVIDTYFGIIYENTSITNYNTTAQGLIGRCCGNDKQRDPLKSPYFFCNIKTLKKYLEDFINKINDINKPYFLNIIKYMSNTFNNTRKNIKKIDSAFSRLETDNNNLELEKHDSDKDYKVFNKLNEAIEFAKNNIKVTFTRKETDEAPKELQQDGENPSVDYVIKRFWGISSKNPARLIPTNDNKWVIYWRPSLIQNKQNTKPEDYTDDEDNVLDENTQPNIIINNDSNEDHDIEEKVNKTNGKNSRSNDLGNPTKKIIKKTK